MSENKKESILGPVLAIAGGLTALGVAFAWRKGSITANAVRDAVVTGGVVKIHTTGYYPFTAREDEKRMEGGIEGAAAWNGHRVVDPRTGKRVQLHTLEMHLTDPSKHPEVSVSGDPTVWPFGQRLVLSPWPNAVFRVVDTGGHFTGIHKVFRVRGEEPLDICVNDSKTFVPKKDVTATIVREDNWEGGRAVATANLRDQTVTGDVIDAYTSDDCEALSRMVKSERGTGSKAEKEAAAWVARNRAAMLGTSVYALLAPHGEYGPQGSGGRSFASTRQEADDASRAIAEEVLGANADVDPTHGAVDFWEPLAQDKLKALGDLYRIAEAGGDVVGMKRYGRYKGYTKSEAAVRADQERRGLKVVRVVGRIELLGT